MKKNVLILKLKLIAHQIEDNFLLKALLSTPIIDRLLRENKKTSRDFIKDLNEKSKNFENGTVIVYIINFTEANGIVINVKGIPLSNLLLNLLNRRVGSNYIDFYFYCQIYALYLKQRGFHILNKNKSFTRNTIAEIEGTLSSFQNINYFEYKKNYKV